MCVVLECRFTGFSVTRNPLGKKKKKNEPVALSFSQSFKAK